VKSASSRRGARPLPAAAALALAALSAGAANEPFERYESILQRRPFGQAVAAPATNAVVTPENSFARTLRLTALIELDGGGAKAGIIDSASNASLYLAVGQAQDGVELVSVDFAREEAVLRKGAETVTLKLAGGATPAPAGPGGAAPAAGVPAPPGAPPLSAAMRMSYAERRRLRADDRRVVTPSPAAPAPPAPVAAPATSAPPRLTGADLEKHLRDYQMEVIRQGLPPLPIPLTPDQDAQLVREGVLPPLQQQTVVVPAP
jgi:hypothetical protein